MPRGKRLPGAKIPNYIQIQLYKERSKTNMSLRFITGRSGTGKTYFIQNEIAEELKQRPMGPPIIVIVPDQLSYSMNTASRSNLASAA